MKKILLLIFGFINIVYLSDVNAQSFITQYDTMSATYYNSTLTMHNSISNNSNAPIQITWKVLRHDFPASWATSDVLGICDNVLCRFNDNNMLTNGSSYTTDAISTTNTEYETTFYLSLDLSNAVSGTHYMTIRLMDSVSNDRKEITFVVNKWATGINNASKSVDKNVALFPNPARNIINITYSPNAKVKTIELYNLIGKNVSSYKVNSNSGKTTLDISALPSGIYYVRLQNAEGEVVATRRFTRQ